MKAQQLQPANRPVSRAGAGSGQTGEPVDVLDALYARGLVDNCSDKAGLRRELVTGARAVYCGFDPTAESLHIGNLLQLVTLRRFQQAGHTPIILIGGATGLIGDPSGKRGERRLESTDTVAARVERIHNQISALLDWNANTIIVNNIDWLGELDTISFLRDVGKHFSVSTMLAKESVRKRLQSSLSFTEFSYSLLQAVDFLELRRRHGCILQIGGSDQWGNITTGIEFVRRVDRTSVFGLTLPLLTNADGTKLGKTERGTIWLDRTLTPPFALYQWLLNTSDADVLTLLRALTFLPREQVSELRRKLARNPDDRTAQRTLAQEVTHLVHGRDALASAERITDELFDGGGKLDDVSQLEFAELARALPSVSISREALRVASLTDLVVATGLARSKSQARELTQSGAIRVFGTPTREPLATGFDADLRYDRFLLLQRGAKSHALVCVAGP